MVHPNRLLAALVLVGCVMAPAQAQQPVSVEIRGGLVTLRAQNAPLGQILAEWARVGGTTIVNADRVTGAPVSLDLKDVPERQALEILLRGVAGYVLAARPVPAPGVSSIDRILILATSTAPPAVVPPPPNRPVTRFPQPFNRPDPEETPSSEILEDQPDGEPLPRPGVPRQALPDEPAVTEPEDDVPDSGIGQTPGFVGARPGNPLGLPAGASATPGVVVPAPQRRAQPPE